MTSVNEIVDRATEQLPLPSRNGGPPGSGGPNPGLVIALAFLAGVAVARFLSWRAHAHPRD
jgi:hypothetical protein